MPYVDLTKRRIYGIWNQMKRRCSDKNNSSYKNYGAKGIEVCKVWEESFESFYLWALNNGYKDDLTIDRIDSTKNYEPNNCRWADWKEQNNNKGNNTLITKDNKTKTISQWADYYNITSDTIISRIKRGCDIEHLFLSNKEYLEYIREKTGVAYGGYIIEYNGIKHNISEWARIYNIERQTLKKRLFEHHSPFEKAILSKEEYKQYRKEIKKIQELK